MPGVGMTVSDSHCSCIELLDLFCRLLEHANTQNLNNLKLSSLKDCRQLGFSCCTLKLGVSDSLLYCAAIGTVSEWCCCWLELLLLIRIVPCTNIKLIKNHVMVIWTKVITLHCIQKQWWVMTMPENWSTVSSKSMCEKKLRQKEWSPW